jgi:hypothetical protein
LCCDYRRNLPPKKRSVNPAEEHPELAVAEMECPSEITYHAAREVSEQEVSGLTEHDRKFLRTIYISL